MLSPQKRWILWIFYISCSIFLCSICTNSIFYKIKGCLSYDLQCLCQEDDLLIRHCFQKISFSYFTCYIFYQFFRKIQKFLSFQGLTFLNILDLFKEINISLTQHESNQCELNLLKNHLLDNFLIFQSSTACIFPDNPHFAVWQVLAYLRLVKIYII